MENNDIQHWCTDLFPTAYTCEDILEKSVKEEPKEKNPEDFYSNIYSEVILEEELLKKRKHLKKSYIKNEPLTSNVVLSLDKPSTVDSLWSGEDFLIFKEAYTKLKERAVKLLCIVETKNLKIHDMRTQKKEMTKQLKQKNKLLSDVVKENMILKEYTKSHEKIANDLESKLQFYEDCNNDLKKIIHQKDIDLKKIRSQLQNEDKMRKDCYLSINKLKENHRVELISVTESSKDEYQYQVTNLRKEIDDLMVSKRLREEECTQFKSSYLDLQKHFINDAVICSPKHIHTPHVKEFLGVADLKY